MDINTLVVRLIIVLLIVCIYKFDWIKQQLEDFGTWYTFHTGSAIIEKQIFESDPRMRKLLNGVRLYEQEIDGKIYYGRELDGSLVN
jgi:hypothetical protein